MYTPAREIEARLASLQEKMAGSGPEAAILVQNTDLYYFTGSCQAGHLVVPVQGEPVYLVRKSLERARLESPLGSIRQQHSLADVDAVLKEVTPGAKTVGLELDVLPYNHYRRYASLLPGCSLTDISGLIREIRMVKSSYEVTLIKEAAKMAAAMFDRIPVLLKAGKTEVSLAGELESVLRSLGHQGAIRMRSFNQELFYGHLMSGKNLLYPSFLDSPTGGTGLSPAYPQSAGHKKINRDEPVQVDYVSAYGGYLVDKARIYCIGRLPPLLEEAHRAALVIQEEIVKAARPGVPCSDLYLLAMTTAKELGYAGNFMGIGGDRTGFVAHGIGLELDELPVMAPKFNIPLQEGMVFALEPKMFLPGHGVVGVENTFLVTAAGVEKLTDYPEDVFCQV
jgi:Xaa-Pro aminopeptidase